ncbi:acyltransferase family protein [Streptomyces sp. WMMC905]|uniref:acyltransferase family protein n=1 Tax=Streptomyces sp. WMMC905 TaxID=3404123 RepID=UPI003B9536F3
MRSRRFGSTRGGSAAESRDPHWDNLRFLSGTLVVLGHATDTITDRDGLRWLQIATWALRVPVFVMVAGYFSGADTLTPRGARRLVESILVPYLLIGLLHTLQQRWFYGDWSFQVVDPPWALWFLLSLFFWRLGLPCLARLRHPLTTSVVAALVVGYLSDFDGSLSLSRTVCFLPFFVVGWRLRQGALDELMRARWSGPAAVSVLAVTAVSAWYVRHDVSFGWLRMSGPYDAGHPTSLPWAWTIRAGVLLCGTVIALAFVRAVPRRRLPWVTYLGAGGLYVYVLHPLVLRPVLRWWGMDWVGPWWEQGLVVVLAVALSMLLASAPVRRLARPVVQPRLPWLFRAEDGERGELPRRPPRASVPGPHSAERRPLASTRRP